MHKNKYRKTCTLYENEIKGIAVSVSSVYNDNVGQRSGFMRNVKMADVAKACGVSIKSVSRVLNNNPNVSPEMREK